MSDVLLMKLPVYNISTQYAQPGSSEAHPLQGLASITAMVLLCGLISFPRDYPPPCQIRGLFHYWYYHIPNSIKIAIAVVQRKLTWSQQNFAFSKTAVLSWYMQNFAVIGLRIKEIHFYQIWSSIIIIGGTGALGLNSLTMWLNRSNLTNALEIFRPIRYVMYVDHPFWSCLQPISSGWFLEHAKHPHNISINNLTYWPLRYVYMWP